MKTKLKPIRAIVYRGKTVANPTINIVMRNPCIVIRGNEAVIRFPVSFIAEQYQTKTVSVMPGDDWLKLHITDFLITYKQYRAYIYHDIIPTNLHLTLKKK